MLLKILRFLLGLALLPACVGLTWTVGQMVMAIQPAGNGILSPGGIALLGGFVVWLLLWFTVPRPVRSYVLAHELTHALWGLSMGHKVSGLSVGKAKGSVEVSETNVLITLAPYFCPLYTLLVIFAYFILSLFFDVGRYHAVWLALVGFTWGFHVTFTLTTLLSKQTDIQQYGYVFSYAFIYFMNALGVALWIVAVSSATLDGLARLLRSNTLEVIHLCRRSVEDLIRIWQ